MKGIKGKGKWLLRSSLLGYLTVVAAPAFCQDGASAELSSSGAEPAQYGDIIVTAQKRSQKINDVGISILVADAAQLGRAGVTDVTDLPKITPGLTTGTTYSGFQVYSLRGVNFNSPQIATPAAVAVYVDEAAVPYATQTSDIMFDVERVEVLKGPQGTLFGQNSTGGSVNIILAKPTDDPHAGLEVNANHFGQVNMTGYVSGPVTDTLRMRVAATTTQFGAWQKGYFANRQKNGDQDRLAGRVLVDWEPTDRLRFQINVNASYNRSESLLGQLALVAPATPANALPGLIGYPLPSSNRDTDFNTGFNTRQRSHQFQSVLRSDFELNDGLTLTYIADYIKTRIRQPRDFDGTALDIYAGTTGGEVEVISQELRASGNIPSLAANYVFGATYQHDDVSDEVALTFNGFSSFPIGASYDQTYKLTNSAAGVFGNVEIELAPKLSLTAGVRYTDTKQAVKGCLTGNAGFASVLSFLAGLGNPAAGAAYVADGCLTIDDTGANPTYLPIAADLTQKEDNWSWRVGLNYKLAEQSLVYGLVSRGYKSGTFPLTAILFQSQLRRLRQEELTSYEVGTKLGLAGNRVQLNLSGFYYDYRDKQFFTYVPVAFIGVASTFVNIPKSTVKGIDAELVARPTDYLTLRGGATYLKTRIGNFTGFNSLGAVATFDGKEFNFAPPWSITFDAEYRVPLDATTNAYVGVGGLYNNRTFADLGETAVARVPARTLIDARVGLESDNGWRLSVWGRNLTNAVYWDSIAYSADTLTRFAGMPRTFGMSAAFKF